MKKIFLAIILIFVVAAVFCCFLSKGGGSYKSIDVDGKTMKATVKGSGNKTIVMLSDWNTDSPMSDFFPLYNKLSKNYRVVVLEYFGYFNSDITNDERSNENIVEEIRTALHKLDLSPPYILMPRLMSGLYSLYYANSYPSEVAGIIGIDMSLPQLQLERWNEETFEKAKIDPKSSKLNVSIINQWNKFYDNSKELKDLKYPKDLPVLAFVTADQIETVDKMIKESSVQTPWIQMNERMITNNNIQSIKILREEESQYEEIVRTIRKFIRAL